MLSWKTVVSTLLLFRLHCCGSDQVERRELRRIWLELENSARNACSASYLEGVAGAALAEPGNAVQVVGGDGLVLLLDKAERREEEAGLLAIPVLQHGGHRIYGAPFNKRRTSQVPLLHITRIHTSSVLMIERQRRNLDYRAPFKSRVSCGLIMSWKTGQPADMCKGFNLKLDCWTERQNSLSGLEGLEETHKLHKSRQSLWVFWCLTRQRD